MFAEYRKLVPATIEKYGGTVRGPRRHGRRRRKAAGRRRGSWCSSFRRWIRRASWYHSPEYAPALAMRLKCANAKLILVEGA
jgi:uncharacterized protein (DUF1330 family)